MESVTGNRIIEESLSLGSEHLIFLILLQTDGVMEKAEPLWAVRIVEFMEHTG